MKIGYLKRCDRSITIKYSVEDKGLEIELSQKIVEIAVKYELCFESTTTDYPKERYFYITEWKGETIKTAYEELKTLINNLEI